MKKTKLEKDLFEFGDYLEEIGKHSLFEHLILNDVGRNPEDKAIIQKCYRNMKKIIFPVTVIDYLCWISTQYLFNFYYRESAIDLNEKKSKIHKAHQYLLKHKLKFNDDKYSKAHDKEKVYINIILFLMINHQHKIHSRNMLRLFRDNPKFLVHQFVLEAVMDPGRVVFEEEFLFFMIMSFLTYHEFMEERLTDKKLKNALWETHLYDIVEFLANRNESQNYPTFLKSGEHFGFDLRP